MYVANGVYFDRCHLSLNIYDAYELVLTGSNMSIVGA